MTHPDEQRERVPRAAPQRRQPRGHGLACGSEGVAYQDLASSPLRCNRRSAASHAATASPPLPSASVTLHYITIHCIILHYIVLHCITLHYIALHYIALHCIALHCTLAIAALRRPPRAAAVARRKVHVAVARRRRAAAHKVDELEDLASSPVMAG